MSIEPSPRSKTIDDLGIDSSIRYAKDQQYFDKTLIAEAERISLQTKSDSVSQGFASEFESLFQTNLRNQKWALFEKPSYYLVQSPLLFSYQMIPSLGGDENVTFLKQRIQEKLEKERKRKGKGQKGALFEDEIELNEQEEESKKLIAFLDILEQLDRLLIEANAKRSQYQRG